MPNCVFSSSKGQSQFSCSRGLKLLYNQSQSFFLKFCVEKRLRYSRLKFRDLLIIYVKVMGTIYIVFVPPPSSTNHHQKSASQHLELISLHERTYTRAHHPITARARAVKMLLDTTVLT